MTTWKSGDKATIVWDGERQNVTVKKIIGKQARVDFDGTDDYDDVPLAALKPRVKAKAGKSSSGLDLSDGGFTENRKALSLIRADMAAALKDVEAKFGVRFDLNGSISYQADQFSMRVVCAIPSLNTARRDDDLAMMAKSYNLDTNKVSHDGFKLVGFNARARARPWVVRKVATGKEYIMKTDAVEARFGKPSKKR